MNLSSLRLFVDVARAGSFTKAAQAHDLDPSVVSRRIASLERDLGFRLLQRTTRLIALTEAGSVFLSRVEPHLAAIDEATIAGRDLSDQPAGVLRVTASTSFGYEILTPLIPKFRESSPDVALELLLTDRRINLIEEGVDLAIRLGSLPDSEFIATKLMPIQFRVYAHGSHHRFAKPPEELDCLMYGAGLQSDLVRVRNKSGLTSTMRLTGSVSISNALALKRCACLGMGPAFLPDWLVQKELETGELIDLFPDVTFLTGEGEQAAWFVYPTRLYVPLKVRRLIDYFTAELGAVS